MKLGQVLSTVDFELVPEGEREAFKAKLAALRDDAPQVAVREDAQGRRSTTSAARWSEHFATFDATPIAAASIGQVYRAHDARRPRRRGQGPVPGRRRGGGDRPAQRRRCCSRWSSAWRRAWTPRRSSTSCASASARSSTTSSRPRTTAASPARSATTRSSCVPDVVTLDVDPARAGHRVRRRAAASTAVKKLAEAERDRFAEICFRFFYGLLDRERIAAGDPHPGNYLLADDGRVCFLDFGLMRRMDADVPRPASASSAQAVIAGDAGGRPPPPRRARLPARPGRVRARARPRPAPAAGEWYFNRGFRRLHARVRARGRWSSGGSPRSPYFEEMRRQTIPPQALLLRRMEGLLFSVLGELRAGADWGALALEYIGRRAAVDRAGARPRPNGSRTSIESVAWHATVINGLDDLKARVGQELGVSDWLRGHPGGDRRLRRRDRRPPVDPRRSRAREGDAVRRHDRPRAVHAEPRAAVLLQPVRGHRRRLRPELRLQQGPLPGAAAGRLARSGCARR